MNTIPYRVLILLCLIALGLLLGQCLLTLHPVGDLNPTFHVASRYMDLGPQETGSSIPFFSILLDYRGFYWVLLGFLELGVTLIALLFCVMESFPVRVGEKVLYGITWFSALALLLWGSLSLGRGGNWMDYEFLSGPAARKLGVTVSGFLGLIGTFCSFAVIHSVWRRGKEQLLDRK